MTTHDIELPPLPSPFGIVDPDGTEGLMQYTARDLQDYAKFYASAAIEADRKQNDRMLAHEWLRPALNLPENAPYRFDYYAQEIERLRNDRKLRGEPAYCSHPKCLTAAGCSGSCLKAAPQPAVQSDAEIAETCRAMGANSFAEFFGKTAPQPAEPQDMLKEREAK